MQKMECSVWPNASVKMLMFRAKKACASVLRSSPTQNQWFWFWFFTGNHPCQFTTYLCRGFSFKTISIILIKIIYNIVLLQCHWACAQTENDFRKIYGIHSSRTFRISRKPLKQSIGNAPMDGVCVRRQGNYSFQPHLWMSRLLCLHSGSVVCVPRILATNFPNA